MGCRIAVDAMGGNRAPGVIVQGAVQAAMEEPGIDLLLVGDGERIRAELSSVNGAIDRVRVADASQSIGMDEHPVDALRSKKDASLLRTVELGAEGEADAVVSAGNTGACVAACQLKMRALPCISRLGMAVTIPTSHGPVVLCDAGANVQAKPHHLYEYAVMGSLYATRFLEVGSPRVGLLSVGGEALKETELTRQTHELLTEDDRILFVGNVEARDLFDNACDVAVCNGFVGNIVVDVAEGLAEGLLEAVSFETGEGEPGPGKRLGRMMKGDRQLHDDRQCGGAPLLGVDGACFVCRGRSGARTICGAVLEANRFCAVGFNEAVMARLAR